jgi:hypothetical protein
VIHEEEVSEALGMPHAAIDTLGPQIGVGRGVALVDP